ncbi:acyl carrier protein [Erysipelothrix larvae]|uniref:Acyl carrier protein n=1 Tax=Erysipelothrix larvae TaxID=1514105 RepID=A0A0X8H1K2_9FIRM|nr:acyl carrier protein [Erysipelothrix larvae]AMC94390.1 acyl carrier protein [Erysipelothrix larvae]
MKAKVKQIVSEILDVTVDEIKDDVSILDDLGADSIAVMEIVMELEGEYGVDVPTEDVVNLKTVNDIVAYIESKV